MVTLPALEILSVKVPVSDLSLSRRWYADVFGLVEEMEWPDSDGVVRGVAFSGLGSVMLALRQHPQMAAATRDFGFINVRVPGEDDLAGCAEHLDRLGIRHTDVMSGATGRLVGFHDLDGQELSFYAETAPTGVRDDAVRTVRAVGAVTPSRFLMTGMALAAATVAVLVAIGLTAMPQGAQPAATFPTPSPSSLPSPVPPPITHR